MNKIYFFIGNNIFQIFLKFVIYAVIAFRRQLDFCELFNFILPFCADYINRLDSISTFIVIKYVAAIMMMVGSDQVRKSYFFFFNQNCRFFSN